MPQYKLVYFDARGRAETSRLLFAQAGVDYEDVRLEGLTDEVRAQYRIPFGSLPVLDVDGDVLCQSRAIDRYLAKLFGLVGKSAMEEAKCDMIAGCVDDIIQPVLSLFGEKDEAKKAEIRKKYSEEKLPSYLDRLEKILISNKGGDGYIVGDQVSLADIAIISGFEFIPVFGITLPLDKYPKLKALIAKVKELPNIKAWIAKRPATNF